MTNDMSASKRKATERGRYKLAVFFKNHQSSNGKAYSFFSNRSQDTVGSSIGRLKGLVSKKWVGKVSWAAIYEDGRMIYNYKDTNKAWLRA